MSLTIEKQSIVHNTFALERHYPIAPERVFSALSDPAKKRRWFAEGDGHDLDLFEMDFRIGGTERAQYRFSKSGPFEGTPFASDAVYLDIVPNVRVVIGSTMSMGGHRISASLATFEVLPDNKGTKLVFTHQAAFFEGSDGPQLRELGWRKLLERIGEELLSETGKA